MKLMIDCKDVRISQGTYTPYVTVVLEGEDTNEEQLDHYIDYLHNTYGKQFLTLIKERFNLTEED